MQENGDLLLVAEDAVEPDDEVVLLLGEVAALEVWAEVVDPAEAAALAAAEEAGGFGEGAPAALAVGADVGDEAVVFRFGPRAFVGVGFITAGRPAHDIYLSIPPVSLSLSQFLSSLYILKRVDLSIFFS